MCGGVVGGHIVIFRGKVKIDNGNIWGWGVSGHIVIFRGKVKIDNGNI